jgi:DNA-binding MarR family transcriptional regulator
MTENAADQVVIPALLRASRGSYGQAIRNHLAEAGYDDLPRNSAYVLGGMTNHNGSVGPLVRELGISKQGASQLIDTLVVRGYLVREVDVEDRRRIRIELTERGRGAGAAIGAAVREVDAELGTLITPEELAGMRAGLSALCAIRERLEDELRAGTAH